VGYEVQAFSPQVPVVHGPLASLHVRTKTLWGAALSAQLRFPAVASADLLRVRLDSFALRLWATRGFRWDAWMFEPALGVGVDLTHVESELLTALQPVSVRGPHVVPDAIIAIAICAAVRFFRAGLAIDVVPYAPAYTYRLGAETTPVIAPLPVRLGGLMEVAIP
jgi:hypothetical protein